mmetsp:Transcript_83120/g.134781  ORF Transcript_83120/g.134781 Transcript_83120/m.134781 type:complete len:190 (+) Transcript_83120:111-680(+)
MGGGASKANVLTEKQIQKYVKETGYAPTELEFLYKRFRFLCKRSVNLSRSDVQANAHLADNQYVKRIFGVMPKNELGEVTFDVFVRTAAVFRPDKPVATKLQYIFNLFDYNMDDTLDPAELSEMISIVRPEVEEQERAHLVAQTVKDILAKGGDTRQDGLIHSKCFIVYAQTLPGIEEMLTLNLVDQLA